MPGTGEMNRNFSIVFCMGAKTKGSKEVLNRIGVPNRCCSAEQCSCHGTPLGISGYLGLKIYPGS